MDYLPTLNLPTTRLRGSAILLQDTTYDFWLADVAHTGRTALKQFPLVESRRRFDDFGVSLGREEYIRAEEEAPLPIVMAPQRRQSVGVGGKRKWGEMESLGVVEEVPARVETTTMDVDVNIRMGYVDLEGLHDGRAASTLLPRLNARKIVPLPSACQFRS